MPQRRRPADQATNPQQTVSAGRSAPVGRRIAAKADHLGREWPMTGRWGHKALVRGTFQRQRRPQAHSMSPGLCSIRRRCWRGPSASRAEALGAAGANRRRCSRKRSALPENGQPPIGDSTPPPDAPTPPPDPATPPPPPTQQVSGPSTTPPHTTQQHSLARSEHNTTTLARSLRAQQRSLARSLAPSLARSLARSLTLCVCSVCVCLCTTM